MLEYYPDPVENLTVSNTVLYSANVFHKGEHVRLAVANNPVYFCLTPEYVAGGYMGDDAEGARLIFDDDAEDADLLSDGPWSIGTASVATLNKTSPQGGDRDLEFLMDDSSVELSIPLKVSFGRRRWYQGTLGASVGMIAEFNHVESNAAKDMEWLIMYSGRGAAVVPKYWDDGAGAWTATETWNTLTNAASLTQHSFTWTTQSTAGYGYTLKLRSASDAAGEKSNFDFIGVYPTKTSSAMQVLEDTASDISFRVPYRSRVATVRVGASDGILSIARLVRSGVRLK